MKEGILMKNLLSRFVEDPFILKYHKTEFYNLNCPKKLRMKVVLTQRSVLKV